MTPAASPAVLRDLAPSGRVVAGLNMANFLLTGRDKVTGEPTGIASDLARELARRLGVEVRFACYDAPGPLADGVREGAWNVAFLAAEPAREAEIAFTPAYLEIEATYLVSATSPITDVAQVDRPGVRIATMARSAYEQYLSRSLAHARLVQAASVEESFRAFVDQGLEALSGLRPRLVADAARLPGSRVLEGRFTAIQQAIGMPRGGAEGAGFLRAFVVEARQSGLVADIIARNGVKGVTVAA